MFHLVKMSRPITKLHTVRFNQQVGELTHFRRMVFTSSYCLHIHFMCDMEVIENSGVYLD